jgi:hypothetical protein
MGKQQQAPPSRRPPAMSAPQPPRRRKKKGRPSLLDLQKRSLRLEQQLQEQQKQKQPQARRSARRNPSDEDEDDDDDDGPASGSGRRERKLRLVMGLHDGSAKVGAPLSSPPLPLDLSRIRANSADPGRNLPNSGALPPGRVRICAPARRPRKFLCYFWHEKAAFIYFISVVTSEREAQWSTPLCPAPGL